MSSIGHISPQTARRMTWLTQARPRRHWQNDVEQWLWQFALGYYALLWLGVRKIVWAIAVVLFFVVTVVLPFAFAVGLVLVLAALLGAE